MKLPHFYELREKLVDWWFRIGGWRNRWLWIIVGTFVVWRVWTKWEPITRILSEKYYRVERAVQLFFLGDWLRSGAFTNGIYVLNALILLGWVFTVIFAFYDARERFDRGWFWAGVAFVFPFIGIMFYLLYRNSSLAEADLLDMEYGFMDSKSWALQDLAERKALANKTRLEHMIKVRQSNLRERFPQHNFSPRYWIERLMLWIDEGDPRKQTEKRRQELANQLPTARKPKPNSSKQAVTQLRGKLKHYKRLAELANLPREDDEIDQLISDDKIFEAIQLLRERLTLAREMSDGKGETTYTHYLDRFARAGIISEQQAQMIDAECVPNVLDNEILEETGDIMPDSSVAEQTGAITDSDTRSESAPPVQS